MTSPTPSEPLTGRQLYHGAAVSPAAAAKLVAASIGTIYLVQLALVKGAGISTIAASCLGNVVVVAGLVIYARRRELSLADLGLARPRAVYVVAAVLLGLSMWLITATLVQLLDPPTRSTDALRELIQREPLVATIVALSVFPAVAEELVFRGVLARAIAARYGVVMGVAVSATTFALYHLNPPQMVSTFVLGLVLGLLALRARSIVPAIIVHTLNNAIAVVLSRDEGAELRDMLGDHGGTTLTIALAIATAGLLMIAKERS
jgi:membrane protease YdiL (CAAX protease family)